jgi:hypothetical protein
MGSKTHPLSQHSEAPHNVEYTAGAFGTVGWLTDARGSGRESDLSSPPGSGSTPALQLP